MSFTLTLAGRLALSYNILETKLGHYGLNG